MPTNLAIDDELLAEALRVGGRRTKRATVNEALAEYVQRRKRRNFARPFGTEGPISSRWTRTSDGSRPSKT
jgi:Arc/MetJ family transcription regulator